MAVVLNSMFFCELSEQERSNLVLFEDNVFMGGGGGLISKAWSVDWIA